MPPKKGNAGCRSSSPAMRGRHRQDIVQAAAKKHKITDEALFYRAFGSDGNPQRLNAAAQAFQEYVRKKAIPREVVAFCGQTFLCARSGCEQPGNASFTRTITPGNTVQYFCGPNCMQVDVAALTTRLLPGPANITPPQVPYSPSAPKTERPSEASNRDAPLAMPATSQEETPDTKQKMSRRIRKVSTSHEPTPAPSTSVIRSDVAVPEKAPVQNIMVVHVPVPVPILVPIIVEVPVPVPVLIPVSVDAHIPVSFETSPPQVPTSTATPPQPSPPPTTRKSPKPYLWGPGQWGNPAKKPGGKQPKKGTE